MLLTFRWFPVAVTLTGALVACVRDDGAPPTVDDDDDATATALPTTTTPTTETTLGESSSGDELPPPICTPGEVQCDGENALEVCDATGLQWDSTPCLPNQSCRPCNDATCSENVHCVGPCESDAVLPSSAGCSFISNRTVHLVDRLSTLADIPEEDWEVDGLVIANPDPSLTATVQVFEVPEGTAIEMPMGDPFTLAPFEWRTLDLDSSFVMGTFTQFRTGGMLRVSSDSPIIAYQHAPWRAFVGNDSSMLLPESALGSTYVIASYPPHYEQYQGAGEPTYFEIIAVQDDTQVRWHAQFAPTSGNGVPIDEVPEGEWSEEVTMNRFDTLRVTASYNFYEDDPHRRDISGSVVEATKPIWVVGASRCSAVPASTDFVAGCDPLQELMIPLEFWGNEYVAPHPPLRPSDRHHWRIYGAEEGIEVTTNPDSALPGGYVFDSRGDFVDVIVENGESFKINADGPVLPVGYLESRDQTLETPLGDPAMYQLVPVDQFLKRYVFVTGIDYDAHYVEVIREIGGPDVILDDGMTVTFDSEPVGGYEFAVVNIGAGDHRIESTGPFGILQFGWANGEHDACTPFSAMGTCQSSYAYPGGMKSEVIYIP
jgi:hypothetical protein